MRGWRPGRKRTQPSKGPFQRFTVRTRHAIIAAQQEARGMRHGYIGTEHILLGLLREGEGVAVLMLTKLGAGPDEVREAVYKLLSSRAPAPREPMLPPGLGVYDEKIALVREQKDAAIDAQDFDQAAALRDSEKRLLAERAQRIADWSAGVDVIALGEELDRLRREVSRLQNLLRQHGIEPSEGDEQTA